MGLLKKLSITIITFVVLVSCGSSNGIGSTNASIVSNENINTTFNNEYKRHIKEYYGQIESKEYEVIRKKIEQELPYKISSQDAV